MFHFDKVHFLSTNVEAQYRLFVSLGLNCELTDSLLKVTCGRTILYFEKSEFQPFYHYCILVTLSGLEEASRLLLEQGIELLSEEEDPIIRTSSWDSDSIYFYDGDDNIAEFIYHPRFGPPSPLIDGIYLQLAELGVVAYDTDHVKEHISSILGESPYKSTSNRFYDIGEPGAMFITIDPQQKLTWFPTRRAPVKAPCHGLLVKDDHRYSFRIDSDREAHSIVIEGAD